MPASRDRPDVLMNGEATAITRSTTSGIASDAELVSLFRQGRESSFDAIVHRYQDRIFRYMVHMVRDTDEAADLAQETFVKAYRSLHRFRGHSSLYTWLYRIALNTSLNYLRKKKLRNRLFLDSEAGTLIENVPLHQCNPERELEIKQQIAAIQAAIRDLPPRQRSIFVMRHFDDLSHGEIAEVVGTSEGAVRAGYFHAVRKLRAALVETAAVESLAEEE